MSKLIGRLLVVLAFGWAGSASAGQIDTVLVDGKEWAQVDSFFDLTWNDINAVCPSGFCGNGTLNGYNMEGWTWASVYDVNMLFNHYIGSNVLGPNEPAHYVDHDYDFDTLPFVDSLWATEFWNDGWRPTSFDYGALIIDGKVSGCFSYHGVNGCAGVRGVIVDSSAAGYNSRDVASTADLTPIDFAEEEVGAWFYRTAVPIPATFPLLGLGLAALGYSRRKRKQHI